MPITPEISRKLLDLKEESGLTFKQIGDEVGSSEANVRRYIMGETKAPDRQLLNTIVKTMGGDQDEIFGKKKPEPEAPKPGSVDILLLERMEKRHQQEIAHLKAAYNATIFSKDQRLEELMTERKRLKRAVAVLGVILAILITGYIAMDILHGGFGHVFQ